MNFFIGFLLGAALVISAWYFNIEPPVAPVNNGQCPSVSSAYQSGFADAQNPDAHYRWERP